uniref:Putative molybdenum carrier protein n=1 Tax=viral metagenome TaxID=1070528 RepID=A0A6M3IEM8_9ZZZZ
MIKKIISGGQTGADRGGLEAGKSLKIKTGGWAPKGYKTENGPDLSLKKFGLEEHWSSYYPERTEKNVRNSHLTLIFGNLNSAGSKLTKKYCIKYEKSFLPISIPLQVSFEKAFTAFEFFVEIAYDYNNNKPIILNIAGNRESKSPGIQKFVEKFLIKTIRRLKRNEMWRS